MTEARRARDVAFGLIGRPYEVETVLRSVELAREVMSGGAPEGVPVNFELFARPAPNPG